MGHLINFLMDIQFHFVIIIGLKKGENSIKYSFPSVLTNMSCIFYRCESLTCIDLSIFCFMNAIF